MYYISGGKDNWQATKATTLQGAKMLASKTYQQSVGGIIEVGQVDERDDQVIYPVAKKRGYDAWQQA